MDLEPRTWAPAHATGAVEFVPIEAIAGSDLFKLRGETDVSTLATSIGRLGQLVPVELRPLAQVTEGSPVRWQVVAGFRRIAALRLLHRDRVLARVHRDLSEEDAWGVALGQALLTEPLLETDLEALRKRILDLGQASWADDLIDEALVRAPVEPAMRERLLELLREQQQQAATSPATTELHEAEVTATPEAEASPAEQEIAPQESAPPALEGSAASEEVPDDGPEEMTPEELARDLTTRLYEMSQDLATAFEVWGDLPAGGRLHILEQMRYMAHLLQLLEAKG